MAQSNDPISVTDRSALLAAASTELLNSSSATFAGALQRFIQFLDEDRVLRTVLANFGAAADFDAFFQSSRASRGAFTGSGRLIYPRGAAARLSVQMQLLRRLSTGEIDAAEFREDFFYVSDEVEDNHRRLINELVVPFLRDLTQAARTPVSTADSVQATAVALGAAGNSGLSPERTKETGPRGQGRNFNREANDEEAVLDVQTYADVIACVITFADARDFCMAIFGRWGRGKTYLSDRVAAKLKSGAHGRKYATVRFSAWKFPSRPEVWIHLYETILSAALRGGWWQTLPAVLRTGVFRQGEVRLFWLWLAVFVTVIPKGWIIDILGYWIKLIDRGLVCAAAVMVVLFVSRFWKTARILERNFLTHAKHGDKLGLQATIGQDLAALMCGWINVSVRQRSRWHSPGWVWEKYWAAIALIIGGITLRSIDGAEIAGLPFALLLAVAAAAVRTAFYCERPAPDRCLLVIDDLDRCDPEHLLAVLESIRLMLDEPLLARRIQVLALVEEDVLKHALWNKYGYLVDEAAKKILRTDFDAKRLMRENFDKLFTLHFRLPHLTRAEGRDVINAFGGRALPSGIAGREREQAADSNGSYARVVPEAVNSTAPAAPSENYGALSGYEKRLVTDALLARCSETSIEFGPRALRAFLFRYQMARLILEALHVENWEVRDLANTLATLQSDPDALDKSGRSPMETVARQLS